MTMMTTLMRKALVMMKMTMMTILMRKTMVTKKMPMVTKSVTCRTFCPLHTPATEHACTFDYHGAQPNCTVLSVIVPLPGLKPAR